MGRNIKEAQQRNSSAGLTAAFSPFPVLQAIAPFKLLLLGHAVKISCYEKNMCAML